MVTKLLKRIQKYSTVRITVCGVGLDAIVADTAVKRMVGLMHRDSLQAGTCMLFTLKSPSLEGIWMRNMRFPIDVLWVDGSGRVVDTASGLRPAHGLDFRTYYPRTPASYVIELQAGFIRRHHVAVGGRVGLPLRASGRRGGSG